MSPVIEALLSFLLVAGATFTFIGSLGLVRLEDFYTRLHGPTKATTLGVGCLLVASSVYFSVTGEGQALSAGIEGQTVKVRTENGRVLSGMAVGHNRVEVQL